MYIREVHVTYWIKSITNNGGIKTNLDVYYAYNMLYLNTEEKTNKQM